MTARAVLMVLAVVLAVAAGRLLGPHGLAVVLVAGIGHGPAAAVAAPPAGVLLMGAALMLRCRRLHREGVLWWG